MARRDNRSQHNINAWPGYVDALSTLLMVLTFVLLFFVIGQQFLSVMLVQRQQRLDKLGSSVEKLQEALNEAQDESRHLKEDKNNMMTRIASLDSDLSESKKMNADFQNKIKEDEKTKTDEDARISNLSAKIEELLKAIKILQVAVDADNKKIIDKDVKIKDLGDKLNKELASRINELRRYQSTFFSQLSHVLNNKSGIEVAGDRFRFQAEILFPVGSDSLTEEGTKEIIILADTLKQIGKQIPQNIPWVLQVEGHADKTPIHNDVFPDNWQLSASRALNVVRLLEKEGIDPHHLAATAFSSFQPLKGLKDEDMAHNRRIEFRLTPP